MLLAFAIIGGMLTSDAQRTVVRVYPKYGTVVKTINNPRVVVHRNANYYVADGVWYRAKGRRYVVVGAPVGVTVRKLPRGNKVVVVNGRRLYRYKGVWYKKARRGFIVVNV